MAELLVNINGGVALVTLNRPQVMNALGGQMREALLDAIESLANDPAVACVVITGAGEAFCAGGDIASMIALQAADDVATIRGRMQTGGQVVRLLRTMDKPVIAAVNGAAAGAGLNLALACDFRYASAKAKFTASFVKIGLVPDWGGHYLLTRIVGTGMAMELMMTGDRLDADEALRQRLVNRVLPVEGFLEAVLERARALAAAPRGAIASIKRGVYLGESGRLDEVLAHEAQAQAALFLGADAREGMCAFMEKRAPRFGKAE